VEGEDPALVAPGHPQQEPDTPEEEAAAAPARAPPST